ncbi:hypothetical protein CROQUDRAFT_666425 [Cronartium quercuum f. sp. fusiforme G11]|uniref:Phosphatidic acid phosphatase type 2/haloperoxidase domain-containing protein n=1 Tax=Cronartium quercuum f. sp. fusiforme G11 TaxID=708437 RepID=A0A9P6N5C6_9BASI|nr:hypothetical protein CROQUDRAFT_666425 [Cronartium quercuum f. sp. fusiforme G11]
MIKPRLKVLFLILLRETQVIVTIATALAILHLRTAHSIWFGLGAISATISAKLLKRFIRQPRPIESNKGTYGMPSTHSSSISFFGIYLFLCCLLLPLHFRLIPLVSPFLSSQTLLSLLDQADEPSSSSRLLRTFAGLSFLIASAIVCWSRVKLGYHTPSQVLAGALIGSIFGTFWFSLWAGFKLDSNQSSSNIISAQRSSLGEWGDELERVAEDSSYILLEAWQMRDGGLLWDGLGRPGLNALSRMLGFGDWFKSGDQMSDGVKPLGFS